VLTSFKNFAAQWAHVVRGERADLPALPELQVNAAQQAVLDVVAAAVERGEPVRLVLPGRPGHRGQLDPKDLPAFLRLTGRL
jgi:hypothetical protein